MSHRFQGKSFKQALITIIIIRVEIILIRENMISLSHLYYFNIVNFIQPYF